MTKSTFFRKAVAIIMVVALGLMAFPQVLMAAESPAYALKGTIGSLNTLAGDDTPWDKVQTSGTIMIQPTDSQPGAKYSAYKLLNIENVGGVLKVSIPETAQHFWKAYLSSATDVEVADIKNHIKNMSDTQASSSMVEEFLALDPSDKPAPEVTSSVNGEKATIATSFGFYIIQQTQAPNNGYIASAPVLACLPMQREAGTDSWLSSYTAKPKDDKIAVSKKVKVLGATGDANYIKETIAEIGDTLEYQIVVDLAKYGSDITSGAITYRLVDELPDGVKYDGTPATVSFYRGDTPVTPTGTYTVAYNVGTPCTLTLDLGEGYATNLANCDTVKITYRAILDSDAVIEGDGNENKVKLTYTSAKGQESELAATAKVYTHELDITKVDKDNTSTKLAGAEFQVYRASADASDEGNAVNFIEISSAGTKEYRVATAEEIADDGVTKVINLAVSDAGEMKIYGLNDQNYYFKETVAPVGYNLPNANDLFEISPAPDASEKIVVDGQDTTYQNMVAKLAEITNDSGINLPVTGGMGTILFTAIGLLLMAGAAYFFFRKKKETH